jgi:glycosyltransferase involved in cell wall biosynthesis
MKALSDMTATASAPPRAGVCIFAHEQGGSHLDAETLHYLDALRQAGFDTVLCSTSPSFGPADLALLEARCHTVLTGLPHRGRFSLFRSGLRHLGPVAAAPGLILFTHDGLYGPLGSLDDLVRFGDQRGLDVWSATDGFSGQYHLHSDFLLIRPYVLTHPAVQAFWDQLEPSANGEELSAREISAYNHFSDALLRMGAFCSVSDVRRKVADSVREGLASAPAIRKAVLDRMAMPGDVRHDHWSLIVEGFGVPFIVKDLLRSNPLGADIAGWEQTVSLRDPDAAHRIASDLNLRNDADASKTFSWLLDEVDTPAGVRLPYFLTQLLTTWPDLEQKLNIGTHSEDAVLNSIAFWEHPQRKSMPSLHWPAQNRFPACLREASAAVPQDAALPISKGALAAWRTRPDLHNFDLDTFLGRQQFVHWQLTLGRHEYRFLSVTQSDLDWLHAPCQVFGGRLAHLPNLALLSVIFHTTPEIVTQLQAGDVAAYNQWWPWKQNELTALLEGLPAEPLQGQAGLLGEWPSGTRLAAGVNVVGLPNGQFGVGEDARTASRALLRAGVKTYVCPAPIGALTTVFKPEWTDDLVTTTPRSRTNLVSLPAADTYQLLLKGWAPVLAGRYNICAWQWELPVWPEKWRKLLNIPDEIWAQSRFVADMFSRATDKPVTYMPLSVEKPVFVLRGKQFFGIPEAAFTFLSVFDCNSWIKRKNPMAAVRAFAAAFPPGRDDVRLVVKIMNSQASIPEYLELLERVATDPRIILIDRFLPRNDMLALIDACDVFVSLHRSEGFGRVIAEAMYMGKAVISTNYSGSVDFAFEGTAYVVDGPLVSLRQGDYVEFEGQQWMDPDIGVASEAYRHCVDDPQRTRQIAQAGLLQIANHHTIAQISTRYHDRLSQLGAV